MKNEPVAGNTNVMLYLYHGVSMKPFLRNCYWACIIILLLSACSLPELAMLSSTPTVEPSPTPLAVDQLGVREVVGTIYEPAATYYEKYNRTFVLYDLSGLIKKNTLWKMPPENMVIGHVQITDQKAAYFLDLPAEPDAEFHDVDRNPNETTGVQIYTYWLAENFMETTFLEEPEQPSGWPLYNTAIKLDKNDPTKILEGWLLVWATDNQQMFPVEAGEDGTLFTEDDIVQPLLQGYTSIYLKDGKLTWDRSERVEITISAPYDQRQYDFSHKDGLTAYQQTLELLQESYPGWTAEVTSTEMDYLQNELAAEMEQAVDQEDELAVTQVFGKMIGTLDNGMLQLSSSQTSLEILKQAYPADFGFLIDTMDDGLVRVTEIRLNSSTFSTNLNYGDVLLEVDGMPVNEAIAKQPLAFFPAGDEETTRKLQEIFLLRKPEGEKIRLRIKNMLGEEESLTLTASADTALLESALPAVLSEYRQSSVPIEIEEKLGFGIIHVYDMDKDPDLTIQMFENAIRLFQADNINDFVIDLQNASGSTFLHLAGYFTSAPINLATYECGENYHWDVSLNSKGTLMWFNSLQVVIGSGCKGACELEALAFSKITKSILYGQTPTYGAFDLGYQAKIQLPNQLTIEFPLCQMQEIQKPKKQERNEVVPDVVLERSLNQAINGPSYLIDQVIYTQLRLEFKKFVTEKMRALTLNELYMYYRDAYSINYIIDETEADYFFYHDVPSYNMHITNRDETHHAGVFEHVICEESYEQIQKVQNAIDVTFTVDYENVPANNVINQYYQPEAGKYCAFWSMGISSYPAGYHEINMQIAVNEPVIIQKSLWDTGQYEFNYQFFLYNAEEES
jgi:C-terminal processing protease CtpA/Prc